jgi:hypothetical protein
MRHKSVNLPNKFRYVNGQSEFLASSNGCGGIVSFDALRTNAGNAAALLQVLAIS